MIAMKGKTILIIDDAFEIRLLVRKILETDGAQVVEADTVDSGIALATKMLPHLILLDLGLKEKTGFDFLELRRNHIGLSAIPVVVLSGKRDESSVLHALELGANHYIVKPFRATQLLQKIRKTLRLNSFCIYRFPKNEQPQVHFTVGAEITQINEGGCQVESPVRLPSHTQVHLNSELLSKLGIQNMMMISSSKEGQYSSAGRYSNEVSFVGMDSEHAKKIRDSLEDFS